MKILILFTLAWMYSIGSQAGNVQDLSIKAIAVGSFVDNNAAYTRVYLNHLHTENTCNSRSVIVIKKHDIVEGVAVDNPYYADQLSLLMMTFSNDGKIGAWLSGCTSDIKGSYAIATRISVFK